MCCAATALASGWRNRRSGQSHCRNVGTRHRSGTSSPIPHCHSIRGRDDRAYALTNLPRTSGSGAGPFGRPFRKRRQPPVQPQPMFSSSGRLRTIQSTTSVLVPIVFVPKLFPIARSSASLLFALGKTPRNFASLSRRHVGGSLASRCVHRLSKRQHHAQTLSPRSSSTLAGRRERTT